MTFTLLAAGCGLDNPFFPNKESSSAFSSCATLDAPDGVVWAPKLSANDRDALRIAFSITGSYEGASGWSNLSSDFDGQGVSLGIMSQSLGKGTLEPLLIKMRDNHRAVLERTFTATQLSSLLGMLGKWESTKALPASLRELASLEAQAVEAYTASAANAEAATWARNTLYASGQFIPEWATALRALAETPEYVSLQIDAATAYHDQARNYMKKTSTGQLRAYLTFFDLVIQNGGLTDKDEADYKTYLQETPYATEEARLNMAVALRVRWVKPEFAEDVKSRKHAIINGKGQVHGTLRDLEREYCFNRQVFYP